MHTCKVCRPPTSPDRLAPVLNKRIIELGGNCNLDTYRKLAISGANIFYAREILISRDMHKPRHKVHARTVPHTT